MCEQEWNLVETRTTRTTRTTTIFHRMNHQNQYVLHIALQKHACDGDEDVQNTALQRSHKSHKDVFIQFSYPHRHPSRYHPHHRHNDNKLLFYLSQRHPHRHLHHSNGILLYLSQRLPHRHLHHLHESW